MEKRGFETEIEVAKDWIIAPQPGPQLLYVAAKWCPVIFYGGARGGGKTSGSLIDFFQDVSELGSNWHGLLVRKTYPELQEVIRQGREMFGAAGASWVQFHKQFRFPEGSTLTLRSIESYADAEKLQGAQYTWICMDEATNQGDERIFRALLACLRWTSAAVPFKRFRLTGNPGGAGHSWIKRLFIDPAPLGYELIEDGDIKRMYIPSTVDDNQILLERDPDYVKRLEALGSPDLVRAWRYGDWNAVLGAYFPEFCADHIVAPFTIPRHWTRFCAADFGTSNPTCWLWFAVSDGSISDIPRSALVVYRELYGSGMTAEEQGEVVADLSDGESISYSVIDPSAHGQTSKVVRGPTVAEVLARSGVICRPADNERLAGWNQIRQRLRDRKLVVFATCKNLVRTIPLMQHDPMNHEDLCKKGSEDHAVDALRYGCMSRPIVSEAPAVVSNMRSVGEMSYKEIEAQIEEIERRKRGY